MRYKVTLELTGEFEIEIDDANSEEEAIESATMAYTDWQLPKEVTKMEVCDETVEEI